MKLHHHQLRTVTPQSPLDIGVLSIKNTELHLDAIITDGKRMEVGLSHIASGSSIPMETHLHVSQMIYVLQGSGSAVVMNMIFELRPGMLLPIAQGHRHEIRADRQQDLKILSIYAKDSTDKKWVH
jgi:mannose-6-phosphate isomerase-like protein (cupin superfamily)